MFRFTIRDVLWLTVVVTLIVAWWIDRSRLIDRVAKWQDSNQALISRLDGLNPNWRTIRAGHGPQTQQQLVTLRSAEHCPLVPAAVQ
jgi:hypothetical protein